MICFPSGVKYGAKLAAFSSSPVSEFDPSSFITKISSDVGRHRPFLSSAR
jgi:hypothetical protein